MEIVRSAASTEEPFEDLPDTGGWINAGNRAVNEEFTVTALEHLERAGARIVPGLRHVGGIRVGAHVVGSDGRTWLVLIHGTVDDSNRAGMRRTDTLKKAGFDVRRLREVSPLPILIVTSHLAKGGAAASFANVLRRWADELVAVEGDLAGFFRLCRLFGGRVPAQEECARLLWDAADVGEQLEFFDA